MSEYTARVEWRGDYAKFTAGDYSRAHQWRFDGGAVVAASASPQIVPLPHADAAAVDPEEAFVAALASCHMLFFLSLAAQRGYRVARYVDDACGTLARDDAGRQAMTHVALRPQVTFAGDVQPGAQQIERLHHDAHRQCFIANSVKTAVQVLPVAPASAAAPLRGSS